MSQLAAAAVVPRARLAKAVGLAFAPAAAQPFLSSSSIRSSAPSLTLQQAAKVGERHEVFHENGFSSDEGDWSRVDARLFFYFFFFFPAEHRSTTAAAAAPLYIGIHGGVQAELVEFRLFVGWTELKRIRIHNEIVFGFHDLARPKTISAKP